MVDKRGLMQSVFRGRGVENSGVKLVTGRKNIGRGPDHRRRGRGQSIGTSGMGIHTTRTITSSVRGGICNSGKKNTGLYHTRRKRGRSTRFCGSTAQIHRGWNRRSRNRWGRGNKDRRSRGSRRTSWQLRTPVGFPSSCPCPVFPVEGRTKLLYQAKKWIE